MHVEPCRNAAGEREDQWEDTNSPGWHKSARELIRALRPLLYNDRNTWKSGVRNVNLAGERRRVCHNKWIIHAQTWARFICALVAHRTFCKLGKSQGKAGGWVGLGDSFVVHELFHPPEIGSSRPHLQAIGPKRIFNAREVIIGESQCRQTEQ